MFDERVSLLLVSLLWGATNPFIKRGTEGLEKIKADSKILQFWLELKFLTTNWKYVLPFLLNQCGSVLHIILLQSSALSLVVPVVNSLTFVSTALSGRLLNEKPASINTYIGMVLVLAGTTLCVLDKSYPIDVTAFFSNEEI